MGSLISARKNALVTFQSASNHCLESFPVLTDAAMFKTSRTNFSGCVPVKTSNRLTAVISTATNLHRTSSDPLQSPCYFPRTRQHSLPHSHSPVKHAVKHLLSFFGSILAQLSTLTQVVGYQCLRGVFSPSQRQIGNVTTLTGSPPSVRCLFCQGTLVRWSSYKSSRRFTSTESISSSGTFCELLEAACDPA